MLNKVSLIGNLGKDPEIRALESGVSRANFSLATNESYKDKNGVWQKSTEWHDIIMWRSMADKAKVLRKGMLVYVEGKLTHRKWTDKEGRDHYTTEITAHVLRILEKRDHSTHPNPSNTSSGYKKEDESTNNVNNNETSDDDLPF